MLSVLSVVGGVLLFCLVAVDVFATVFVIGQGAGPQSRRLASASWLLALRLHSPDDDRSHRRLRLAGPFILFGAVMTWVVELIIAWSLIFVPTSFGGADSVGMEDRLTFGARMIVGRGQNREVLNAQDGLWDLVASLAGLSGVAIVSLALAYALPVLAAVAHKRSVAAHISTLGNSVASMREMVDASDQGGEITWHLETLTASIAATAERHRSYPVLYYFHSSDQHAALAPAVARLALLVKDGMPGVPGVDSTVLRPLARAMHDLLGAMQQMGLDSFAMKHPDFDHDELDRVGIEPMSATITDVPSTDWLRAYVAFDGWSWDIIDEDG